MKLSKTLALAITLSSIITVTGCGAQKVQQSTPQSSTKISSTDKNTSKEETKVTSIDAASHNMRNLLKDMKAQLANKEDAKVTEGGTKLEESWSSIEDAVKAKNPALYEKVEGPLGTIEAGVKVKPIDGKTITTAAEALDKVLSEVQNLK